jgi:hypothetical protein
VIVVQCTTFTDSTVRFEARGCSDFLFEQSKSIRSRLFSCFPVLWNTCIP